MECLNTKRDRSRLVELVFQNERRCRNTKIKLKTCRMMDKTVSISFKSEGVSPVFLLNYVTRKLEVDCTLLNGKKY